MEDELNNLDGKERQNIIDEVVSQVGLRHLITFDDYYVCEQVRPNRYLNSTSLCLRPCVRILNFPIKPEK